MIKANIESVRANLSDVCRRLNKHPEDITLVGITKYAQANHIQAALDAGLIHIGENRVQDAQDKFAAVQSTVIVKHLVGHLQTNKVKTAVKLFDVIESVDSLKLAQAIQKEAEALDKIMDVFIQVNTSGESQKFGIPKGDAGGLIDEVEALPNLNLSGLMTIAPFENDGVNVRQTFRDLKMLFDQANAKLKKPMVYLSMGMSGDYVIALEEGSNMVRIGQAIFKDT